MKIKIITIHNIPNFGSVFQTYALAIFLKYKGYEDTEVVDYNPRYFKPNTIKSRIAMLLNIRAYYRRKNKFSDFIKRHIPLTKTSFSTIKELEQTKLEADVFIAGGDQLWNVYHACGSDDAYKLTFFKGKKISYATSMGQENFPIDALKDLASKIKDFSAVSVRETSSVNLLKKVGIRAVSCVDPVYLLPASHYEKLLPPISEPPYVLVYLVTPSKLLEDTIEYLSKKHGLKVILCSGFSRKCTCDKFLKNLGPDEILSYIKHAEIVLSSSFHATSFSLIFEKQFFTILPDEHTNERIVNLLNVRGLSDRIISDSTDLKTQLNKTIDYSQVESYSPKIEESIKYLKDNLK